MHSRALELPAERFLDLPLHAQQRTDATLQAPWITSPTPHFRATVPGTQRNFNSRIGGTPQRCLAWASALEMTPDTCRGSLRRNSSNAASAGSLVYVMLSMGVPRPVRVDPVDLLVYAGVVVDGRADRARPRAGLLRLLRRKGAREGPLPSGSSSTNSR